ncbi:MAG: hypothetical protein JNK81_12205 [Anaerolineales bacterium]|nr:hypothetical protein [Anaerolineales bacterium]
MTSFFNFAKRPRRSVVAITDHQGDLISQHRYLPFGGTRQLPNQPTSGLTDYGYTGQRNLDEDLGLMDYKARFYSPYLNHFTQPDSIVPDPTNPQAWNRFSYANNNPVKFNDPSGHCSGDATDSQNPDADCWAKINEIENLYPFVDIDPGNWTEGELSNIQTSLNAMENSFGGVANFESQIGNVTLNRSNNLFVDLACDWGFVCVQGLTFAKSITLYDSAFATEAETIFTTLHEFGHVFGMNGTNKYTEFAEKFWEGCEWIVNGKCFSPGNPVGEVTRDYASSQPAEDFADTFAITI